MPPQPPAFDMNFSVLAAGRKWPCATKRCGKAAVLVSSLALMLASATPGEARQRSPFADVEALFGVPRAVRPPRKAASATIAIPLPQPRPAAAPPRLVEAPAGPAVDIMPKPRPAEAPGAVEKPADIPPAAAAPVPPSACRLALSDAIAVAPSIPDITGPGACGGVDLVRLEAVILRDMTRLPLKPAATLRCEMATVVAAWLRDDIAPLAVSLGSAPAALDNFDSFDCRGRNRVSGAKVSEHGHANALDIRAIALKNGTSIALTDRATPRESREKVLQSACARFTTVLGPGSDGYHEDHIHLDLADRRSGYRICQWTIDDPLPAIAPLLPAARPAEAPPRETTDSKSDAKSATAAEPNAEENAEPEPAPPPRSSKKQKQAR